MGVSIDIENGSAARGNGMPFLWRKFVIISLFFLFSCPIYSTTTPRLSSSSERLINQFIFRDKAHLIGRSSLIKPLRRAHPKTEHVVVFAVKPRNLEKLEKELLAVSDPSSKRYGKHWTRSDVGKLTRNPKGSDTLLAYFQRMISAEGGEISETGRSSTSTTMKQIPLVQVIKRSLHDEYIVVKASIKIWEQIFSTAFYEFVHNDWSGKTIYRAMEFSLPQELDSVVEDVFNVRDFPFPMHERVDKSKVSTSKVQPFTSGLGNGGSMDDYYSEDSTIKELLYGYVTPKRIHQWYNITLSTPESVKFVTNSKIDEGETVSQLVYSTIGQTVSPSDLQSFQDMFSLPRQPITSSINGHVDDKACAESIDDCTEANLDFQYIIATTTPVSTMSDSKNNSNDYTSSSIIMKEGKNGEDNEIDQKEDVKIETISYYDDSSSWTNWLVEIASMTTDDDTDDLNPSPSVISISYGSIEFYLLPSTKRLFNVEVMKLGLQGVTVVVAAGDDGVAGFGLLADRNTCGYYATFPASSQYVTAVGGTMVS